MDVFQHILALNNVSYFKAPYGDGLKPSPIPYGFECVELIVNGGVMYDDGKDDLPRKCGSIFWHIGGEETIYRNLAKTPYECMVFWYRVDGEPFRRVPRMTFWPDPQNLREFVWGAFKAYKSGGRLAESPELMAYTYSTLYWHALQDVDGRGQSGIPQTLSHLLEYVENHLGDDLQISDLTAEVEVSAPYLYKLFRKHFNTSPHQYILSRKLAYACRLLTSTSSQVKSICSECGMENPETFCRAFRKAYGMSPLEYRKSGGSHVE